MAFWNELSSGCPKIFFPSEHDTGWTKEHGRLVRWRIQRVSLSPEEAGSAGLHYDVRFTDMTEWASVRRVGAPVAGAKIITERGTGRILGAHLLGPGADEVINVFAAAMRGGLTADDIRSGIWAYPTHASDIVYLL